MNDLKGIIEDCNKSDLISNKVIKKIIEIIGQEKWQDLHDENNDICTTMGELIITLKGIEYLEKENAELQGKMKKYIRFGEIPKDEKSKIGNGCIGDGYEVVGYEKGVSVWDCVYNFDTDLYQLVAPHPTRFTSGDFSQSYDPDNCCGCDSNEKIYVVTGIEVGYGADNEPLIKDIKIVKELPFDYFKQKVISDRKIKELKENG